MKVAESLWATEAAIDNALARAAELNGNIVSAHSEANLSALVGQEAFEVSASAFAALARARCDIVETHKRLTETKNQIGLRTVAIGDGTDKTPPLAQTGDARHLQAVA